MRTYLSDSKEHLAPLFKAVDDDDNEAPITLDPTKVELIVVAASAARPIWAAGTWNDATIFAGRVGVWSGPRAAGTWAVYAHIVDTPEVPIIPCGQFRTI